jgi:hypothetical protein
VLASPSWQKRSVPVAASKEYAPSAPHDEYITGTERCGEKRNWPELAALTSIFSVELPGIEPDALPGNMPPDLPVRSISVLFSPARCLRIRFQALTASRMRAPLKGLSANFPFRTAP